MARSNVRRRVAGCERLGAVRVGAGELGLAVPQPGEVERHVGGHAHEHDAAAWPDDGQASAGSSRSEPTPSITHVGAARELVADQADRAGDAAHGAGSSSGSHTMSAPSSAASAC